MTTGTLHAFRRYVYETAEALAPTWERRRAQVDKVSTPVRQSMLRELRPREADTVLELTAGVGETGFEAAAIVGDAGCRAPPQRRAHTMQGRVSEGGRR